MTTITRTNSSIERNSFDYAQAYAETQSSNPTVVADLVNAYNLIAQNQGITVYQFLQILEHHSVIETRWDEMCYKRVAQLESPS